MIRTKLLILLIAAFFTTAIPSYSLKIKFSAFRLNDYIYYEILYKIQGVPSTEFANVVVIEETSKKLVFEYNGQRYTAKNLAQGAIYVDMPEGLRDRYLTRSSIPTVILSQFQY